MSLYREKEGIRAQIVDTERLLTLIGDHPIMSISYREKLNDLRSKLESLAADVVEASVRLLFSGGAVNGSQGIKASFVTKTVRPFQSLVKTQAALVRFGSVGDRRQRRNAINTDLFLTALPTGSFGVELSQLQQNDLYDENEIAVALKETIQLIYSAAESDERFEALTENVPKQTLTNLKAFLKEVASENSFIKMETGDLGLEISKEKIQEAYSRVDAAERQESEIFISGVLRGILLDSGKFEAVDNEGNQIAGVISKDLEEHQIIILNRNYLNTPCRIHLKQHTTTYITGAERITYELLGIDPQ
jgi:hypothetical protein